MIKRLVDFSLDHRFLVLVLWLLVVVLGLGALRRLPIDAVPDVTNVQVQVLTNSPGLAPEEVEKFISFPVETAMSGLPRIEEIRSVSKFGLSVVTVVFEEGTDIYWARQLVGERLTAAREQIPEGYGDPEMGPISTGLGEIYQFEVRGEPMCQDGTLPSADGRARGAPTQHCYTPMEMFRPMAATVVFALAASLVCALTLMPVLASLFLKRVSEKEPFLFRLAKRLYVPALGASMRHKRVTVGVAVGLFLASLGITPFLGAEFIPRLDEGAVAMQIWRLPSISLEQSNEISTVAERVLKEQFPEVETVISRTGRAEIATDPMGVEISDTYLMLAPPRSWPRRAKPSAARSPCLRAGRWNGAASSRTSRNPPEWASSRSSASRC